VPGDLVAQERPVPARVAPERRTAVAAAISTAAFIASSLNPHVGETATVQSASGTALLAAELFWLSAAAMGASFAMLLQASGITRPADDRRYWNQFFVGLIAGFILVALIPIDAFMRYTGLSRPLIAVLGAFFASMLFRFLPGPHTPPPGAGGGHATQEP
jgi:hypothetical protein